MSANVIVAPNTQGMFEAEAPFDKVVDSSAYYTVQSLRSPAEMLANKLDLFKLVWEPTGATELDYQQQLAALTAASGMFMVLSAKNKPLVYLPSTFVKSYPLVDGVLYEHMCVILDCGVVPGTFKDVLNSGLDHCVNYLKDNYGMENPTATIGTIQTRAYVSKEQAAAWENTRQQRIKGNPSDLVRANKAEAMVLSQAKYIEELQEALKKAATDKTTPTPST